jgi:formiminoglutamase
VKLKQDPGWFYSRGDSTDPRLGDIVSAPNLAEFQSRRWDVAIIGLPDDRGVLLNKGRKGASEGPTALRLQFYRLVPPKHPVSIADLGDLVLSDNLELDHEHASNLISVALGNADRVVVVVGGHDWGFAPIRAITGMGRTGFINIDAHLDVRPDKVPHSGTSYWRALEGPVDGKNAVWFGIQPTVTSSFHLDYVVAKGGTVFFGEDPWTDLKPYAKVLSGLNQRCDVIDVSLDLDVFAMSVAPGVSAPQVTGLELPVGLTVFRAALQAPSVKTIGIYELSPPHDVAGMTARLAARCLWEVIATKVKSAV